jgi:hypothetical protein
LFDKDLSHGEVRVYLALLAYDWNEKGHSDYSEEHMAGHLGLCVRQYRTYYSSLVKKGYIRQVRHGEHMSATTFPRIRVEANTVVDSYRKG